MLIIEIHCRTPLGLLNHKPYEKITELTEDQAYYVVSADSDTLVTLEENCKIVATSEDVELLFSINTHNILLRITVHSYFSLCVHQL